uniref:Uncharacterized protein n=1 Tax=viral metagenome TaxID=1070528 RepID=A0A6C0H4H4_9ZZZZ
MVILCSIKNVSNSVTLEKSILNILGLFILFLLYVPIYSMLLLSKYLHNSLPSNPDAPQSNIMTIKNNNNKCFILLLLIFNILV